MSDSTNQANEVLAQLLQRALDGVDAAVEFSQAQIPDVVEQLLMWKMVESIAWGIVGIAIIGVGAKMWSGSARLAAKAYKAKSDGEDWVWLTPEVKMSPSMSYDFCVSPAPKIVAVFVAAVGLMISSSFMGALKIAIAPKLYLLDYAAQLMR